MCEEPGAKKGDGVSIESLRFELAQEEVKLMEMENKVELHSAALSHLRSEYNANVDRVLSHFEPEMRPLRQVISVLTEKMDLVRRRIEWLQTRAEAKVAYETNENNAGKRFDEMRDMRSRVSAWIDDAQSALERSYEAIRSCPPDSLAILSNYEYPPDAAIATTRMVQQLRKDVDCSWTAAQVLLSCNYFTAFFVPRAQAIVRQRPLLEERHMVQLEWFCSQPQFSVKALYASSAPVGCLGQWLHALRNYYRVKLITSPTLLTPSPSYDFNLSPDEAAALGIREMEYLASQAAATLHRLIYESYDGTMGKQIAEQSTGVEEWAWESATDGANASTGTDVESSPARDNGAARSDSARAGNGEGTCMMDEEVRAVAEYKSMKERLHRKTNGGVFAQITMQQLRDRLKELENSRDEAIAAMREVDTRARAELREICEKYDTVMLPLENDLELFTERFISIATQDINGC